jgi:hypothetical protein
VGIVAVGANVQNPLGKARLYPGDDNAVFVGELVGGVDRFHNVVLFWFVGHGVSSPFPKYGGILARISGKNKPLGRNFPTGIEWNSKKRGGDLF